MVSQEDIANDHLHGVVCKEPPRAYNLAMAKVEVVLASGGKLYRQVLVFTLPFWVSMRVLTVPVALALSFAIVVLAKAIEFIRVWNTIGIDTNRIGCHLNVGSLRENSPIM